MKETGEENIPNDLLSQGFSTRKILSGTQNHKVQETDNFIQVTSVLKEASDIEILKRT